MLDRIPLRRDDRLPDLLQRRDAGIERENRHDEPVPDGRGHIEVLCEQTLTDQFPPETDGNTEIEMPNATGILLEILLVALLHHDNTLLYQVCIRCLVSVHRNPLSSNGIKKNWRRGGDSNPR